MGPLTATPPGRLAFRTTEALERIARDRSEGARALGLRALRALLGEVRRWPRLPPEAERWAATSLALRLRATQPAMGQFRRWAAELDRRATAPSRRRFGRSFARRLQAELRRLDQEPRRVAVRAGPWLASASRVLTFSRSATVLAALHRAARHGRPLSVAALESLPGGEGRALARELRARGIRARTVPDLRMRRALRDADVVVVGADTVDAAGGVLHKVGTRRLALLAREAQVPVIVLAGSSKWSRSAAPSARLPRGFDRTPRRLVSAYVTDRAVLAGGRTLKRGRPLRRPRERPARAALRSGLGRRT